MVFRYKIFIVSVVFFYSCDDFFLSELDECGEPGGDNSSCLDECNIPNGSGILQGNCDCEGNVLGCDGVCGSGLEYDICLECGGGAVTEHSCGCENLLETKDCLGECGGLATADQCGVCNGDNSLCTGCMINGFDNYSVNNIIADNQTCFIDYNLRIQPILDINCTGCHGSSGGINLESYLNLINSNIIQAGDSSNSILWQVIQGSNPSMPPGGPLNNNDIHKISLWIEFGALEEN